MRKWIAVVGILCLLLLYSFLFQGRNHGSAVRAQDGGTARSFYVSNHGDDGNAGTSADAPWRTLEQVNRYKLSPGDTVCFERGGVWRGQLLPQSGTESGGVIRYTAYGTGENPWILGSESRSGKGDWRQEGETLWMAGPFPTDVGNIIFDNGRVCGIKVWKESELRKQNEFWYDPVSRMVKLYSKKNPAERYRSVECALRRVIVDQSGQSYIQYDGLTLKYGGAHGIAGGNTGHITVRNCMIGFMGGGDQYEDGRTVRFGNGVEFWNNAHDNRVEGCLVYEIYDAGLTNQGSGDNNAQYNITYSGNRIWNCEYSYEYWNGPATSVTRNILFEDNVCWNAGKGWGHKQRPDPSGRHVCLFENTALTENLIIRNNIFDHAEESFLYIPSSWKNRENLILTNNRQLN